MFEDAKLVENGAILEIHIPMKFKQRGGRKQIILPENPQPPKTISAAQLALARAHRWQKMLDSGEADTGMELAHKLRLDVAYVGRILRLTTLAPDIVEAILNGKEPNGLFLADLRIPLPLDWEEQRKQFGFSF